MTKEEILQQKFPNASQLDWYKPICDAMDKYAEQKAIEFAECLAKESGDYYPDGMIKELFEYYKSQSK